MIEYRLRDPFVLDHAGMIGPTTKWKLNEYALAPPSWGAAKQDSRRA
jgi:hypothetical protein